MVYVPGNDCRGGGLDSIAGGQSGKNGWEMARMVLKCGGLGDGKIRGKGDPLGSHGGNKGKGGGGQEMVRTRWIEKLKNREGLRRREDDKG